MSHLRWCHYHWHLMSLKQFLNSYFEEIPMCSENKNDWVHGKYQVSCIWHTCTFMWAYVCSFYMHKFMSNYHILINHILKICEYASTVYWHYIALRSQCVINILLNFNMIVEIFRITQWFKILFYSKCKSIKFSNILQGCVLCYR